MHPPKPQFDLSNPQIPKLLGQQRFDSTGTSGKIGVAWLLNRGNIAHLRGQIMRTFALLIHDHPKLHLDLLVAWPDLVAGTEILWTWRLTCWPNPGQTVDALRISNHQLLYLDHEGPTRSNRGTVRRIASGAAHCSLQERDRIQLELARPTGQWILVLEEVQGQETWRVTRV